MVSKMGFPYPLKVGKALVGNDVQRVAPVKPSVKVLDVAPVWMVTVILLAAFVPCQTKCSIWLWWFGDDDEEEEGQEEHDNHSKVTFRDSSRRFTRAGFVEEHTQWNDSLP